jgi:hypothetical protein
LANPYGITEVDLPGVYGAVQNQRNGRIQQMLAERQLTLAEQAAERASRIETTLARIGGREAPGKPQGGLASAYSPSAPAAAPQAAPAAPAAAAQPQPGGVAPAAAAAPQQTASLIPQEILQELATLGPEGIQAANSLRQLNAAQLSQVSSQLAAITPLLIQARQKPADQRRAFVDASRPDLRALGFTDEQISSYPLDDQHLDSRIALGTPVAQAIEASRPNWHVVEGEVINFNRLPTGTESDPVGYRSPYMSSQAGIFTRPGAGVNRPSEPAPVLTDEDIRALDAGGPPAGGRPPAAPWAEPTLDERGAVPGPQTFP